MATTRPENLKKAYRKERSLGKIRMAAVNIVYMNDESIQHTADSDAVTTLDLHVNLTLQGWRHSTLRDLPSPCRPPKMERNGIGLIMSRVQVKDRYHRVATGYTPESSCTGTALSSQWA